MLERINRSHLFEEVYCLILCAVSIACWEFIPGYGIGVILLIGAASILLLKDIKYAIACVPNFLFVINDGFSSSQVPIFVLIFGGLFIGVLIYYFIKNGFQMKKAKSGKALLIMSVFSFLPLLWHNIIPEGMEVLYAVYASYLGYFIIYILFAAGLKKNCFSILVSAFSYIGILLTFECAFYLFDYFTTHAFNDMSEFYYHLGWGICNEAGIMMCFSLPFIFIQIAKSKTLKKVFLSCIKLAIVFVGICITTSRGAFIFGLLEMLVLAIWSVVFAKKHRLTLAFMVLGFIVVLAIIEYGFGISRAIQLIKQITFSNGLESSGRFYLYERACQLWKTNNLTMIFGNGIVAEMAVSNTYYGAIETFVVYHSTFFEALACFGVVGLLCGLLHLYEKYKLAFKFDKAMAGIITIGFIFVDLYGLIDNTYGMYYYMIPLVIIMGVIDNVEPGSDYELYTRSKKKNLN